MVLIPFKAQFVSVIITVILACSEFFTYHFLIASNSYSESHRLRKGEDVKLRNHLRRAQVIAVISLLMFIALEIVVSNFSDPVKTPVVEKQPCFVVDGLDREKGRQDLDLKVDSIESQCTSVDNTSFTQLAGNVSETSSAISCSQTPLFKVKFEWLEKEFKLSGAGGALACEGGYCVLVVKRQKLTYFSIPFPEKEKKFATDPDRVIAFSPTDVFFDTKPFLDEISKRALNALANPEALILDPYELRRRLFSGSRRDECDFEVDMKDETQIATGILVMIVAIMITSTLFYVSCLGIRKWRFCNLSDPMQWATCTFRMGDEVQETLRNPMVKIIKSEADFMFLVREVEATV